MTVNLVTDPEYGYSLAELCGTLPSLAKQAQAAGVQIVYSPSGVMAVKNASGSKTYGLLPMKGSTVTLLKDGKIGPASKESLKYQLEKLLNEGVEDHGLATGYSKGPVAPEPTAPESEPAPPVSVYSLDDEPAPKPSPKAKPAPKVKLKAKAGDDENLLGESAVVDVAANKLKAKVALLGATSLGQPVTGTSSGSTYYVAAIFKGLNLALRYQSSTLSLRVEGELEPYKLALGNIGFSIKPSYASLHINVPDTVLLRKVFGAVIGTLGFERLVFVCDPTALAGE